MGEQKFQYLYIQILHIFYNLYFAFTVPIVCNNDIDQHGTNYVNCKQ